MHNYVRLFSTDLNRLSIIFKSVYLEISLRRLRL